MGADKLAEYLFAGGTALAGLVLVFLGGVFTAYDGFDAEQRSFVRGRYLLRAWLGFAGLAGALGAATGAVVASWVAQPIFLRVGTAALGISFVVLLVMSLWAIRDMS